MTSMTSQQVRVKMGKGAQPGEPTTEQPAHSSDVAAVAVSEEVSSSVRAIHQVMKKIDATFDSALLEQRNKMSPGLSGALVSAHATDHVTRRDRDVGVADGVNCVINRHRLDYLSSLVSSMRQPERRAASSAKEVESAFATLEQRRANLEVAVATLNQRSQLRREAAARIVERGKSSISLLLARLSSLIPQPHSAAPASQTHVSQGESSVAVSVEDTLRAFRHMQSRINTFADTYAKRMDVHAEAQQVELIRTFRVMLQDVHAKVANTKAMWGESDEHDEQHAYVALTADVAAARADLGALQASNERLQVRIAELKKVIQDTTRRREALLVAVGTVKRRHADLQQQVKALGECLKKKVALQNQQTAQKLAEVAAATRQVSEEDEAALGQRERYVTRELIIAREKNEKLKERVATVRAAHLRRLAEAADLEIFLRQCIADARGAAYRSIHVAGGVRGLPSSVSEERSKAQELFESQIRVYEHVLDKCFPASSGTRTLRRQINEGSSSSIPVIFDMKHLWQQWTASTSANVPSVPAQGRDSAERSTSTGIVLGVVDES